MEFLGIGPGELLLILVVLLVAVGPERLPGLAQQAGRLLVRGRNWLQSSPDAAMLMRARQELEQELSTLRSSLLEVQSVRDEVIGAAKQIEGSVGSLASTKVSLGDDRTIAPKPAGTPAEALPSSPPAEAPGAEVIAPAEPTVSDAPAPAEALPSPEVLAPVEPAAPAPAPEIKLDQWAVAREPSRPSGARPNGAAVQPAADLAAQERAAAAFDSIELRLQAIMADLHALQQQLKQGGALAGDWQPPSWGMSMAGEGDDKQAPAQEPIETGETAR
jgi:sec-independent protein translocase protein TatB